MSRQDSIKNYEEVECIGSGAFGVVYKARDLANEGRFVALKKMRIPISKDGVNSNPVREVSMLKQLQIFENRNIVKLLAVCHGKHNTGPHNNTTDIQHSNLYLVFEHIDQDLGTYLERCPSPGLGPDLIKSIMYQILKGVDFLHSNRVLHRDLKPQNILITNDGVIKITDFGLAKIYGQRVLTSLVVTLWYRAPEVLLQTSYASSVDIWSCGCIFYELFKRQPMFKGNSEADQLKRIFEFIGSPDEKDWSSDFSLPYSTFAKFKPTDISTLLPEICEEGKDLFMKMLKFDFQKRISAFDTFKHPYFKEYIDFPPFQDKSTTSSNQQKLQISNHNNQNNQNNQVNGNSSNGVKNDNGVAGGGGVGVSSGVSTPQSRINRAFCFNNTNSSTTTTNATAAARSS